MCSSSHATTVTGYVISGIFMSKYATLMSISRWFYVITTSTTTLACNSLRDFHVHWAYYCIMSNGYDLISWPVLHLYSTANSNSRDLCLCVCMTPCAYCTHLSSRQSYPHMWSVQVWLEHTGCGDHGDCLPQWGSSVTWCDSTCTIWIGKNFTARWTRDGQFRMSVSVIRHRHRDPTNTSNGYTDYREMYAFWSGFKVQQDFKLL